ncbi:MAG: hypothetical protein N2512_04985, partial [Armatimonadetes bacterium]|nr:hypothetical protein [Armatimonadota bacterium]
MVLCVPLFASLALEATVVTQPINVGDRKQLFIDNRFIAESENVELCMNPPVKRGIVLRGERPWEEGWIYCSTVLDDGTGEYKLYYIARAVGQDGQMGRSSYCLVTSRDGVHWTRPNLGIVEFDGSKDNNILPFGADCVFLDPKAAPEQRYKMLCLDVGDDPEKIGAYIAYSADGIHCTRHPERVLPFAPDTQNQVFYDTRLGKYVAYVRCGGPLRKVGRTETDDLLSPWPYDFHHAITYDELDPWETDVYTPCVMQYPWAEDAYFAFPSMYYHFPPPPKSKYENDGLLEIQLAVSRDGVTFTRPDRRGYVPLGVWGSSDGGAIYMAIGMIRRGDEIYQYYTGYHF